MILSAKVIKNPQKTRECNWCERIIIGHQLKIYGMADDGKPYNSFWCIDCAKERIDVSREPKLEKALE